MLSPPLAVLTILSNLRILFLIWIILGSTLASASILPSYKTLTCAARVIIFPVTNPNSVETGAVVHQLRQFRLDVLGYTSGIDPSPANAWADSEGHGNLRQVAQRIFGIESHRKLESPLDEEDLRLGVFLRGKDAIEKYLTGYQALLREGHPRDFRFWETIKFLGFGITPLGGALTDYLAQSSAPSLNTALAMVSTYVLARTGLKWDFRDASETEKLRLGLEHLTRGYWAYTGETTRIGADVLRDLHNYRASTAERPELQSETIMTEIGMSALFYSLVPGEPGDTYVLTDRLFYVDPQTGEPSLSLFLRTTRRRPVYRLKNRESALDIIFGAFAKHPQTILVPVSEGPGRP